MPDQQLLGSSLVHFLRESRGHSLADPAFLYKLLLEQAATIGCTVLWELENHKESKNGISLVLVLSSDYMQT
ncbi:hypothetical protein AB3S75_015719 [Citrus x aurantiifolia]